MKKFVRYVVASNIVNVRAANAKTAQTVVVETAKQTKLLIYLQKNLDLQALMVCLLDIQDTL